MSARHVKGTLFVDYVRMLKVRKDVDWSQRLHPGDLRYLTERIQPNDWYPMETFERMGLAILNAIADGDLELVRGFGKLSVDWLANSFPELVARDDPRETLMRFHVMRKSFFDFAALDVTRITDGAATIRINYRMGDIAEEAASFQTMGVFERLLEVGGARLVHASFVSERWAGAPDTVLELRWRR